MITFSYKDSNFTLTDEILIKKKVLFFFTFFIFDLNITLTISTALLVVSFPVTFLASFLVQESSKCLFKVIVFG